LPHFSDVEARYGGTKALRVKRNGKWEEWTYTEYLETNRNTARAFLSLGLDKFHGVGILGHNSPEWMFSSCGAIFAGGLSVGIYSTSSAEVI